MATLFNDEIVTATELKARQKHWFDIANQTPVSVTSGRKKLVIVNRDTARNMYAFNHWADAVIRFSREVKEGTAAESAVFPWLTHLRKEETEEFYGELLAGFEEAAHSRRWESLDELLSAWIATAEAKTNPATKELLSGDRSKREYVRLD